MSTESTAPVRLPPGSVLVVGAGLIGTSVALALSRGGVQVRVEDVDPVNAAVAASRVTRAAGSDARSSAPSSAPSSAQPAAEPAAQPFAERSARPSAEPALVVVASRSDHLAEVVAAALPHAPVGGRDRCRQCQGPASDPAPGARWSRPVSVRGQPSDGGKRTLWALGGGRRPFRRPHLGGHPARHLQRGGRVCGRGSRGGLRRGRRPPSPRRSTTWPSPESRISRT